MNMFMEGCIDVVVVIYFDMEIQLCNKVIFGLVCWFYLWVFELFYCLVYKWYVELVFKLDVVLVQMVCVGVLQCYYFEGLKFIGVELLKLVEVVLV